MSFVAIDVREVSFRAQEHFYSPPRAILENITFAVQEGQTCGFVGANGAGKTTTIQLLLGQLRPSAGELLLFGQPASWPASRRQVGYLPERQNHPGALCARKILAAHGALRGIDGQHLDDEVQRAIHLVELEQHQHRPTRHFSKGMLQRLGLGLALVGRPKLLVLDEPLSGLDPPGRHLVRELLLHLKSLGCSIFFSTHILADVELLCDQVVVLRGGSLVFSGAYAELTQTHPSAQDVQVEVVGHRIGAQVLLLAENLGATLHISNGVYRFIVANGVDANKLASAIVASSGILTKLAPFGGSALEALLLAPQGIKRPPS